MRASLFGSLVRQAFMFGFFGLVLFASADTAWGISCNGGTGTCTPPTDCNSSPIADPTNACGDEMICCLGNIGGGSGNGGIGTTCAGGNGTCNTVADCSGTQTSDPAICGSLICCIGNGTGSGPGSGNNTSGGSVTCPTDYKNVAGVCFPEKTGLSEKTVPDIITALLSWLLAIFGFIAILGFIISGVQYLLSAGDEGMAETAKRNMKYSIIGIIVALSGWIIIKAIDALLNASPLI